MKYITAEQYEQIKSIPRGRLTARFIVYAGAIIVRDNKILLCTPMKSKYPGWQLPGGKTLWNENIKDTVKREILEETGLVVELENILGIFQRETTAEDEEYLRIIFSAKEIKKKKAIDPEIKETKWFDIQDILDGKVPLQSQQMLKEIQRYSDNKHYPLEILDMYNW